MDNKVIELAREAGFAMENSAAISAAERFYTLARADLEAEIAGLHTTMMAAAVEIQEQWEHHCDEEGFGPANLMHRLERGINGQYGYDAKTIVRMDKRIEDLEAENAKLRSLVEQYIEFMSVAIDWNLPEVEIDGEMASTYDLIHAARAALGE